MHINVGDVLLVAALLLAAGSLTYSITEHIQAKDHVTKLEDDVYGTPLEGLHDVRAGDGLIAVVKALGDRIDKIESDSPRSLEIDTLKVEVEAVRRWFCRHLGDHTKYAATPVYATLEDTWCKDYLE